MRTRRGGCAALHKIDLSGACDGARSVAAFVDAHIPPGWIELGDSRGSEEAPRDDKFPSPSEGGLEGACIASRCVRPEIDSPAARTAKMLGRASHGIRGVHLPVVANHWRADARNGDMAASASTRAAEPNVSPAAGRPSRNKLPHARPKPRRSEQALSHHRLDTIFVLNAASRLDRWTHAKCGVLANAEFRTSCSSMSCSLLLDGG